MTGIPHGESKKDALYRSALTLFVSHGFHGTSTALIAREAHVATGTLFHYFQTKEKLIEGLYLQIKRESSQAVQGGITCDMDVREKIRMISWNLINWGVSYPEKIQFMEQFCLSPYVSRSVHEEGISQFLFLREIIQEGIAKGIIRDHPVDLIISSAMSWAKSVIQYVVSNGSETDIEETFEIAYDILTRGMFTCSQEERLLPVESHVSG